MSTKNHKSSRAQSNSKGIEVEFEYDAVGANGIFLAGDFNRWNSTEIAMKKGNDGIWRTSLQLAPGEYEYRFVVDGQWETDPYAGEYRPNEFGTSNCVLVVTETPVKQKAPHTEVAANQ